jgi:hypothetical protein
VVVQGLVVLVALEEPEEVERAFLVAQLQQHLELQIQAVEVGVQGRVEPQ